MSTVMVQHGLTDLLERAGSRIRQHNRADCPRCGRKRAVSCDESKGVYHCHGQACDFSGNAYKLARELGLSRRLTAVEYRELCKNRDRADHAARLLYERVRARRSELLDYLHLLNIIEANAHMLGPDNPATWDALSKVYAEREPTLAELDILESTPTVGLVRFLAASAGTRDRLIEQVMAHGGVRNMSNSG